MAVTSTAMTLNLPAEPSLMLRADR
jgi:hypothetical protein